MPSTIRIKMCCHSAKGEARFEAKLGDTVLFRDDQGRMAEGTISEIISDDRVRLSVVDGTEKVIAAASLVALMLGN